jgi:uncharacterized protein (DUF302 family)
MAENRGRMNDEGWIKVLPALEVVMLYAKQATGTVERVSRRLIAAASARGLKLVGRHLMKWNDPLFEDAVLRECRILEFSNVVKFRRILESSASAGAALPCRVSIDGAEGEVTVSTLRPTALLRATGQRNLTDAAESVERSILGAIDEVCGPAERSEQFAERLVAV